LLFGVLLIHFGVFLAGGISLALHLCDTGLKHRYLGVEFRELFLVGLALSFGGSPLFEHRDSLNGVRYLIQQFSGFSLGFTECDLFLFVGLGDIVLVQFIVFGAGCNVLCLQALELDTKHSTRSQVLGVLFTAVAHLVFGICCFILIDLSSVALESLLEGGDVLLELLNLLFAVRECLGFGICCFLGFLLGSNDELLFGNTVEDSLSRSKLDIQVLFLLLNISNCFLDTVVKYFILLRSFLIKSVLKILNLFFEFFKLTLGCAHCDSGVLQ